MPETEQLILEKARQEDWEDMYRGVWSRPECNRYMFWDLTKDEEAAKERMARTIRFQRTHNAWTVFEKESGKAIGFAGVSADGEETAEEEELPEAREITRWIQIKAGRSFDRASIMDRNIKSRLTVKEDTTLAITATREPVGGLYFEVDTLPCKITITVDDRVIEADPQFLHFYVGGIDAEKFTLTFHDTVKVTDIHFLSQGRLPDWVQLWEPTPPRCDLMIMAAHYDDESLFFGGIIPWALDQGAVVNVAYFCDHRNALHRTHEMLNGLWTSGLRTYPVFGTYPDSGLVDFNTATLQLNNAGYSWEDLLWRQVEVLRMYKPQVILTHSQSGEYGHGRHVLYEELCTDAAMMAGVAEVFPNLTEVWGAHSVRKVYVHNYRSFAGQIWLDLDQPLDSFGGRTPYQITIEAFLKHKSQQGAFTSWLKGPGSAAGIVTYSPCDWGLYYSSVGPDTRADTFFENITFYADQPA